MVRIAVCTFSSSSGSALIYLFLLLVPTVCPGVDYFDYSTLPSEFTLGVQADFTFDEIVLLGDRNVMGLAKHHAAVFYELESNGSMTDLGRCEFGNVIIDWDQDGSLFFFLDTAGTITVVEFQVDAVPSVLGEADLAVSGSVIGVDGGRGIVDRTLYDVSDPLEWVLLDIDALTRTPMLLDWDDDRLGYIITTKSEFYVSGSRTLHVWDTSVLPWDHMSRTGAGVDYDNQYGYRSLRLGASSALLRYGTSRDIGGGMEARGSNVVLVDLMSGEDHLKRRLSLTGPLIDHHPGGYMIGFEKTVIGYEWRAASDRYTLAQHASGLGNRLIRIGDILLFQAADSRIVSLESADRVLSVFSGTAGTTRFMTPDMVAGSGAFFYASPPDPEAAHYRVDDEGAFHDLGPSTFDSYSVHGAAGDWALIRKNGQYGLMDLYSPRDRTWLGDGDSGVGLAQDEFVVFSSGTELQVFMVTDAYSADHIASTGLIWGDGFRALAGYGNIVYAFEGLTDNPGRWMINVLQIGTDEIVSLQSRIIDAEDPQPVVMGRVLKVGHEDGSNVFSWFEIDETGTLEKVDSLPHPWPEHRMALHDDLAYVTPVTNIYDTTADSGMEIYDVSDMYAPALVARIASTPGLIAGIAGDHLITYDKSGIYSYPLQDSQLVGNELEEGSEPIRRLPLSMSPPCPNPFNPATSISFTLPAPGQIDVSVYDQMGRRVRTLHDGSASSGESELTWDGCDDAGSTVAAGVYHVRLVYEGRAVSERVTLIK